MLGFGDGTGLGAKVVTLGGNVVEISKFLEYTSRPFPPISTMRIW